MGRCATHDAWTSSAGTYSNWCDYIESVAGRDLLGDSLQFERDQCEPGCCEAPIFEELGYIRPTSGTTTRDQRCERPTFEEFGYIPPDAATKLADELDELLPRVSESVRIVHPRSVHISAVPMRRLTEGLIAGLRRAAAAAEEVVWSG